MFHFFYKGFISSFTDIVNFYGEYFSNNKNRKERCLSEYFDQVGLHIEEAYCKIGQGK